MIDPKTADQKPVISKPSTSQAVRYNSDPLIMKVNNPSERMLIGMVNSISNGLSRAISTPRIKAATIVAQIEDE